jgi:hypothetical protein
LVTKTSDHFTRLIALAHASFTHVEYTVDTTPARAILRLHASYGPYRVFVTELFSDGVRKYRYYVLRGDRVEVGFDNSPDPRAIRLKYGRIGAEYAGELVHHLHRQDKTELFLTEAMTFEAFLEWVTQRFPLPNANG